MNIYQPHLMTINKVIQETPDIKTFHLVFQDEEMRDNFRFKAGQFAEYSAFGHGESTFCIASSPTRMDHIECCFRSVGKNTAGLFGLSEGDTVGFRGPYGNVFPLDKFKGKDLIFIAGGIALPPLRSVIWNVLDKAEDFGHISIVYGARTVEDLVYKREIEEWEQMPNVTVVKTVDPGGETPEWKGHVGFVPHILENEFAPNPDNTIALICGPPIMIKFTFEALDRLGFKQDQLITTLENRMKCGLGKCGRCNIGSTYVCLDGPVFWAEELAKLPKEY
ncbi:MAG: FAD/NAD(P)-binding protein [Thiomargarita sp.]|nr:FAD/NAD(P)-binding protein [Thiomargarita sp.]